MNMNASLKCQPTLRLTLHAETAADLMTPNPVSVRETATIAEAVTLLTVKGISAAPVINDAGHPVGVLSQSDILVHDRHEADRRAVSAEFYQRADLGRGTAAPLPNGIPADTMCVRDLMTPVVFSVPPDSPVQRVIADMTGLRVHRLFVVDAARVLVGVISALDVLRHLSPE